MPKVGTLMGLSSKRCLPPVTELGKIAKAEVRFDPCHTHLLSGAPRSLSPFAQELELSDGFSQIKGGKG